MNDRLTTRIDPELEAEAIDTLERLDRDAAKELEELKTSDPVQYRSHVSELIKAMQADQLDERRSELVRQRQRFAPVRKQALARLLKSRGVKTAAALRRS
jgi:putative lipoic acid-binding regulatory protein